MIELPPNIQVNRDADAERGLLDRARTWLEADGGREGKLHASDLLMPRKGYWRVVDPQPLSDREIGLFLVGKVLHAFILSENGKGMVDLRVTDEGSTYSEELGIWYSPDKLGSGVPVEVKTSRAMYPAKSVEDLEVYLRQLLIYMAAEKSIHGRIVVMYTNAKDESGKTSPQFRVYTVEISREELEAVTLQIRKERDELVDAWRNQNCERLPLCPAWLCHPEQCEWWAKCKPPGRYENFEYLKGKRR